MIGPAGSALDGGGSPGNKRASSPRPEAEVSEAAARRGIRAHAACRRPTPRVPERTRGSQTPAPRGRSFPCGVRTDGPLPGSGGAAGAFGSPAEPVTTLLDTHFSLWMALRSKRLRAYPWIDHYSPWTVSPVSLLEIVLLGEAGRLQVRHTEFLERLRADRRFVIDDVGVTLLVTAAIRLAWTRDPFDRLLAAHSAARRLRLC